MTTYNTYQEAKIANPDSEILTDCKKVEFTAELGLNYYHKCNPADYCMTVERFLADGNEFVEGDLYIETDGDVNEVYVDDIEIMNGEDRLDNKRFILRAAALEEKDNIPNIHPDSEFYKKPRTKVEWIDVHHTEAVYYFTQTDDDMYAEPDGAQRYDDLQDYINNLEESGSSSLYRRIETPITWQEELYDYLDNSCEMNDNFDDSFTIEIEGRPLEFNLNDDEFVDMCKLVASLNSVN